jgi:hypothetical protein
MVFYATFYNISIVSWRSVLLVEDTWVPVAKKKTKNQTSSYNVVSSTPHRIRTHTVSGDRHWFVFYQVIYLWSMLSIIWIANIYLTIRTVPNSNRKIVKRGKVIWMTAHFLGLVQGFLYSKCYDSMVWYIRKYKQNRYI